MPPKFCHLTKEKRRARYMQTPKGNMIPSAYKPDLFTLDLKEIKTQKARGVYIILRGLVQSYGTTREGVYATSIWPQNISYHDQNLDYRFHPKQGWFARPCPTVPRHGFVESRPVTDYETAMNVWHETVMADPEGEMLLCPRLTGNWSGIATHAGVTWGRGNDGVTSGGQGETLLVPTPGTTSESWNKRLSRSRYDTQSRDFFAALTSAYIEIVEHNGENTLVQLRDGPPQPTTKDFIPAIIKVKRVLRPIDDSNVWTSLLDWEKLILRAEKGDVVWLDQLPLSSHYAVHAIAKGIPAITSVEPKVGDTLRPSTSSRRSIKLTPSHHKRLSGEVKRWWKRRFNGSDSSIDNKNLIANGIATIHALSTWDGSQHLLSLRAVAFATLLRYIHAACMGELRHWDRKGPGRTGERMRTKLPIPAGNPDGISYLSRNQVFSEAFEIEDLKTITAQLRDATKDYRTYGWGDGEYERRDRRGNKPKVGSGGYGYGGPAWGNVAEAGAKYGTALQEYIAKPSQATYSALVMAVNTAVHMAHNGGVSFSKWGIGKHDMEALAAAPGLGLMSSHCARICLGELTPEKGDLI